jgi:hypothetical protein
VAPGERRAWTSARWNLLGAHGKDFLPYSIDQRLLSDFRKRHLKALGALFAQVLVLCHKAGL